MIAYDRVFVLDFRSTPTAANPNNGGGKKEENCIRVFSGYNKKKKKFFESKIGGWGDSSCLTPASKIDSVFCKKPANTTNGKYWRDKHLWNNVLERN